MDFDDCDPNAVCINKYGSFGCKCKAGYNGYPEQPGLWANGRNCFGELLSSSITVYLVIFTSWILVDFFTFLHQQTNFLVLDSHCHIHVFFKNNEKKNLQSIGIAY